MWKRGLGSIVEAGRLRKTGFNDGVSEVLVVKEGQVMLCHLYHKHNVGPGKARVGWAVWVDIPCQMLIRLSLVDHSKCEFHNIAMKMESL